MGYLPIYLFLVISQEAPIVEFTPNRYLDTLSYIIQPMDEMLVVIKGGKIGVFSYMTMVNPDGKMPLYTPRLNNIGRASGYSQNIQETSLDVDGIIYIGNSTLAQARLAIEGFYSRIYGNVRADITIIGGGKTYVYIEGEVNHPGAYSFYNGMTIDDYIGMAGGFTEFATGKGIYVQRNDIIYNNVKGTFKIEKGDKIVVPRDWFKDHRDFMVQVAIALISALNTVLAWEKYLQSR